MPKPKCFKDLQVLTGCSAVLCRFILQSSSRCLTMYEAIKTASKSSSFAWTKECEYSFNNIKEFLASPHVLAKALPYEPLIMYLLTKDFTVASVLIKEVKTDQSPVYYTCHTLKDAECAIPQLKNSSLL